MKIIKSLEDIFYYAAKDNNVSPEVVENVHKHLWKTIRKRLSKPHQVGLGIYLPNFMRISLREGKIYNEWQNAIKFKDVKRDYSKRYFKYYDVKYYETLFNEIKRLEERFSGKRRFKLKDNNENINK